MAELDPLADAVAAPVKVPFAEVKVPLAFSIGQDGRALTHQASWPAGFPAARCMDDVLAKVRFTCPVSGRARVTGSLVMTVDGRERSPAGSKPR